MQTQVDGKNRIDTATGWLDFANAANEVSPCRERDRSSRRKGDSDFHTTKNWEEYIGIAFGGWGEGLAEVKKLSAPMVTKVTNLIDVPVPRWADEGEFFDVGEVLHGSAEPWVTFDSTEATGKAGRKYVHIAVNMSVPYWVRPDVLIRRGAAIAALVDGLQVAGHGVKVTLVAALSAWGDGYYELNVPIKEASEVLGLDSYVAAIAHPDTLRRMMFSYMETWDEGMRRRFGVPSGGYGMPEEWKDWATRSDIYVGPTSREEWTKNWGDVDKCEAWILKQLEAQGVTLR